MKLVMLFLFDIILNIFEIIEKWWCEFLNFNESFSKIVQPTNQPTLELLLVVEKCGHVFLLPSLITFI